MTEPRLLSTSFALIMLSASGLSAQMPLTARDSATHALNRLAFGPTPGQVDSIARSGVTKWINEQLHDRSAGDDALRTEEQRFSLLHYDQYELAQMYTDGQRAKREMKQEAAPPAARGDTTTMTADATKVPVTPEEARFRDEIRQLDQVTVYRAVRARRQLAEVMADFWTNHFNIFLNKGQDRYLLPTFIEQTIRPRVLGKFEDLLIATAHSPAMLFYLDNAESVTPGSAPPQQARFVRFGRLGGGMMIPPRPRDSAQLARLPRGLNENYARELLELHTLGVDGGYTQQDVQQVARIMAGWSTKAAKDGSGFEFHEWAHDRGEKIVLGQRFPAGHGEDEGVRLLQMLANEPATMHHISVKLCQRLVADVAPDGCVDDAVHAWKRTGGDIREVVRAIVTSPDFWAATSVRSKVKSPYEFAISAVRAVGSVPDSTTGLAQLVKKLGQPLYLQASPAGYPERSDDWTNSGALLARMNAAVALAGGKYPGLNIDLGSIIPATSDWGALVDRVNDVLLSGQMSAQTRAAITAEVKDAKDPEQARALAVGLALGGPDFQRQ